MAAACNEEGKNDGKGNRLVFERENLENCNKALLVMVQQNDGN